MKGLCVGCCTEQELENSNLCEDCKDALLNPINPKLQALSLDDQLGFTCRNLARRHSPDLLGRSLEMRRMEDLDLAEDTMDEKNPIRVILDMESAEELLGNIWLKGQPVPEPCDEATE